MKLPRIPISKNMALMLGAVVLAAISVVLVKQYLDNEKKRYQMEVSAALSKGMVQVVVPVRDVMAGTVVNGSNMSQRLYPQDLVYEDAITTEKWREYAGRLLVKPVRAGKPLLTSDFIASAGSGFSGSLPADTRAVTISVDSINSINGMIQPGDRVDVLLSQRDTETGIGTQVLPLLRRTQVLATGRLQASGEDGGPRTQSSVGGAGLLRGPAAITEATRGYNTITVAVTPTEASALVLAQQVGQLRVVLASANQTEGNLSEVPRLTHKELIAQLGGGPAKPAASSGPAKVKAPAPVKAPPRKVEFIIGTTRGIEKSQSDAPVAAPAAPASSAAATTVSRPEEILKTLAAVAASSANSGQGQP